MAKKVEQNSKPSKGDEITQQRVSEILNESENTSQPNNTPDASQGNLILHNSNQTECGRAALQLIHKYFINRRGSTHSYLAQFIIKRNQAPDNFDAFMYTNEYNLFFRATVEEAYADGLYWQPKETGFIRVWSKNGVENYVCAANFNMIGNFRRKKHSKPDLVPQKIKDEAISQLKKSLMVND